MHIPSTALVPGMILAKDLYDRTGILLMSKETCLTGDAITKLRTREIEAVDIQAPSPSQREEQETLLIPQITAARERVVGITASIMSDTENLGDIDPNLLKGMVGELKEQIELSANVLLNLSHIKTHDNYLFSHVVNVCVVALILGRELNLNPNELRDLGVSALLHDVGMVQIAPQVYDKEAPLSTAEWSEIKQHPQYGYELLAFTGNFPDAVMRGIIQHHERLDGSGYPKGLSGTAIDLFGRIIAVADVYDACISARKYRRQMTPREALQNLLRMPLQFGKEVLKALVSSMAAYPIGSFVRLNTGEIAKVVGINRGEPFRPDIQILFDRSGRKMESPIRINLSENAYVQTHIAASIEGEELGEVDRRLE